MEHEAVEAPGHAIANFYDDPYFWVAVSFALFVGVFIKYLLPPILKALDTRSAEISQQLEQANRLRAEAEALLAASKIQQEAMREEAALILAHAERDAADIAVKAAADLAQITARRMAQTDEKIARAEAAAIAQIRQKIVDVAIETARNVIADQLSGTKEDPAIARALTAIERQVH
jgi:F-type H+-transporting ATPase subunit b